MGLKAAKKPTPVSSPATLRAFPAAQAAESEALSLALCLALGDLQEISTLRFRSQA